ncbi:MAG: hypothetical protein Q4G07_07230, partial [Oscillospiraceae bacterium]|nr:hypothetical protein [Oscillospiraceae bacterium]
NRPWGGEGQPALRLLFSINNRAPSYRLAALLHGMVFSPALLAGFRLFIGQGGYDRAPQNSGLPLSSKKWFYSFLPATPKARMK